MPWITAEPLSLADRTHLVADFARQWVNCESFVYGIFDGDTPIGSTGLHPRIGPGGVEIGYWVHPAWTGRGIATATTRALTTAALSLPGIDRVEIHHDSANVASRRIPEKLGFDLITQVPDPPDAPGEIGIKCRWRMTPERWPIPTT
jgi:RimJ/RimL family protein N-acetyltransferase